MRWIVNSEEMMACDSNTIRHFGVPSLVLMERAALGVVRQVLREVPKASAFCIVCGNGNNGADGLAVARLLWQQGCKVTVVQVPDTGKRTPENQTQRDILARYGIHITERFPSDIQCDCVIDALFGVGLSREPKGIYAEWITAMNALGGLKAAVDMPSGVSSDDGAVYEPCFQADLTVTFAYEKAGQILYPGREKCGKTILAEIGITDDSWLNKRPSCHMLEPADLRQLPKRPSRSNKGTFGRVLAIAGSTNMAGAALFCAQSAYRTGCGLVKICTTQSNRAVLQGALPEAVLAVYDEEESETMLQHTVSEALAWADVVILGPGIGTGKAARQIVSYVLKNTSLPVVADADALNILAEQPKLLTDTPAKLVLTPHPGEMARLTGRKVCEIQRSIRRTAEEFAARYHVVCVLKDAVTVIAGPSGTCFNDTGCSAMAKGGSGDVLTGVIAGLLAQGMEPEAAAQAGVFINGLAGEAAAKKNGRYSVLARDILAEIGGVMDTGICKESL